jgi:hypothetical protein
VGLEKKKVVHQPVETRYRLPEKLLEKQKKYPE